MRDHRMSSRGGAHAGRGAARPVALLIFLVVAVPPENPVLRLRQSRSGPSAPVRVSQGSLGETIVGFGGRAVPLGRGGTR